MVAMGQKETKVADLRSELSITRQTLYRHVAPDGTLRKDRLKVIEAGQTWLRPERNSEPISYPGFPSNCYSDPSFTLNGAIHSADRTVAFTLAPFIEVWKSSMDIVRST